MFDSFALAKVSEVLEDRFHRGAAAARFEIYYLSWSDVRPVESGTHWYLRDPERNVWIDLGLERAADGTHIPYAEGRSRAFMTGYEPSKRARRILEGLGTEVTHDLRKRPRVA